MIPCIRVHGFGYEFSRSGWVGMSDISEVKKGVAVTAALFKSDSKPRGYTFSFKRRQFRYPNATTLT